MTIDHWMRRAAAQGTAPTAPVPSHAPHDAAPSQVMHDCRVPGVAPDLTALEPWVDRGHPADAKPQATKDPVAQVRDNIAELQAARYASVLVHSRGGVDNKQARYEFLNTLDKVDDPTVRHKMMVKFAEATG